MNGLNIIKAVDIRILITPPISPSICKKLNVYLECNVLMPSKKKLYMNNVTLSLASLYYNDFEISKNYPSNVFWPYYIKSSSVIN